MNIVNTVCRTCSGLTKGPILLVRTAYKVVPKTCNIGTAFAIIVSIFGSRNLKKMLC